MKMIKCFFSSVMLILILPSVNNAQSNLYERVDIWKKDLDVSLNDQGYDPAHFNFNPYLEINVDEYLETFELSDDEKFTMYMVFSTENSKHLGTIKKGDTELWLDSDKVVSTIETPIEVERGSAHILSYRGTGRQVSSQTQQASIATIGNLERGVGYDGKVFLAELLIFNKILSEKESNQMASVLAIKYGISLPEDKDYVNSNNQEIWKWEDHSDHIHRVTALARDDFHQIDVKESRNSREGNLTVSLGPTKSFNRSIPKGLTNLSNIFWSDDDKELSFITDGKDTRLGRTWDINFSDATSKKKELNLSWSFEKNLSPFYNYYLVIDGKIYLNQRLSVFGDRGNGLRIQEFIFPDQNKKQHIVTIAGVPKEKLNSGLNMYCPSLRRINDNITVDLLDSKPLNGNLYMSDISGSILDKVLISNQENSYTHVFKAAMPGTVLITYESGKTTTTKKVIVH